MQMDSKLFDDLAKLASGAMGTAAGLRDELEAQVRQQLERMLARMDVVTREEFDAVREMAETARAEQEALAAKVAELESRLGPAGGDETSGSESPGGSDAGSANLGPGGGA